VLQFIQPTDKPMSTSSPRSRWWAFVVSFVFIALFAAPTTAFADDDDDALAAFRSQHEDVIRLVETKAPDEALSKRVDQLLDYDWIAKTSLGGPKKYAKRCEPRCAEFEALLTRLIRENYLRRVRQSDKGSLKYVGVKRKADQRLVQTRVTYTKHGRTQTLEIGYVMHKEGDRWVVRNMITDGVSLAKNYRYEFNKVLKDEGIDGLIARLETKLAEVAKAD
jgi:phospholipid transport system substrate-binding protein